MGRSPWGSIVVNSNGAQPGRWYKLYYIYMRSQLTEIKVKIAAFSILDMLGAISTVYQTTQVTLKSLSQILNLLDNKIDLHCT